MFERVLEVSLAFFSFVGFTQNSLFLVGKYLFKVNSKDSRKIPQTLLQYLQKLLTRSYSQGYSVQKQPFRGVLRKRYSEDMQQIYRKTSMPKCFFNKFAENFIKITLWYGYSPVNLLHIFRTPLLKNTSGGLLLSVFIIQFKFWQLKVI